MAEVFRFAPSPNGSLHLGHALSALLNFDMANACGGRFLLRIEDIDPARCRPEYEAAIYRDLHWLGLTWEEPVRRQSEHAADYRAALDVLKARGLVYPAFLSRSEVKSRVTAFEQRGNRWPCDPDGTPLYPIGERDLDAAIAARRIAAGERHMWRLNIDAAIEEVDIVFHQGSLPAAGASGKHVLTWTETSPGAAEITAADPAVWGDVVLWRWDAPSSYHLSVVLDDALQGVTHVVRGRDLYHSTPVHRLLQALLGLPAPVYHHHPLLFDDDGEKLSKSFGSTGLGALRQQGLSASDIRRRIGLGGVGA